MTPFSRPFASVAVAAVLTATTLVPAQEVKKAATPEGSTTEVIKAEVKAAGPAPLQIREVIRVFPGPDNQVRLKNGQPAVNPQMVENLTATFRTVLRAEYQLVLAVCEPSKDQRREIARAGERALKSAAELAASWQMTSRRVVFKNGINQVEEVPGRPDPRKILREALADAVKTHLSSEQAERYGKEVDQRAAEEKQTVVRNLVEQLDRLLILSQDQREKIAELMSSNWDESWCPSLQLVVNENPLYFPPIPDPFIVPVLTRSQVKVWNATAKLTRSGWNGFFNGMGVDAKPLEDAELGDAPKADAPAPAVGR